MTKLAATQLSLIAESDFVDSPVGDWAYDELGTNNFLVPNSDNSELGTNNFLVPNSRTVSTGSCRVLSQILHKNEVTYSQLLVPNLESWKPPIGCFQQKPIKGHLYWYWRYYDNRGKKASKYLAK
ncbi:hypothetical protein, partial [Chamaesiphon sp.]|uniref:hypothetical protein n=1 Tax=Chamaesiphon sp. TaxID=2814140 RepID=UPI003593A658